MSPAIFSRRFVVRFQPCCTQITQAAAEGQVTNASFSGYRVPRMRDVPKLDLLEWDRRDLSSVGAGETPIIAIAPAIANAIHQASGVRRRGILKLTSS